MRNIILALTIMICSIKGLQAQLVFKNNRLQSLFSASEIDETNFQMMDQEVKVLNYDIINKRIKYPVKAKDKNLEDVVYMRLRIDKKGKIKAHHIRGKYEILNNEVEKHLFDLKFKPAKYKDRPIASWTSVKFVFELENQRVAPL